MSAFRARRSATISGLPITDAARLRAEAWDASLLSMPEHQCKPHPSTYGFRGVGVLRIWEDRDEDTQQLIKIHTHIAWQEQHREIWMDGRPHPPEYAAHTWQGFSTGSWEGDVLVVKTTHLKAGWMRRNGLPLSDRATMTDRFHRYGDVMTHVSIVEDPVYLTEPLVKTNGFLLQPNGTMTPYPCEPVVEIVRDPGFVPHYLPGQNPFLDEFGEQYHLPPRSDARRRRDRAAGVRGDAAMSAVRDAVCVARACRRRPRRGLARRNPHRLAGGSAGATRAQAAPIDLTGQWVAIVNEDWRWRMVTPPKGDYASVPLNDEGRRVADQWDRAHRTARAKLTAPRRCCACRRACAIRWQGDDAARGRNRLPDAKRARSRSAHRAAAPAPRSLQGTVDRQVGDAAAPAGRPGLAGAGGGPARAGGYLEVADDQPDRRVAARNGVPYSEDAVVTEYFARFAAPNGDEWLMVTTIVDDPRYLTQRYITSSHFRREAEGGRMESTSAAERAS